MRPRAAACLLALVLALACATLSPRAAPADPPPPAAPAARPAGLVYTGRVLDPDGKPVAGASVWADNGESYQTLYVPHVIRWRALVPDPDALAETGPATRRSARVTGPDGRFEVEGVPPPVGGWVLATHADFASGRATVGAAGAVNGRVEVGDVRLAPGSSLSVCARRADAARVARFMGSSDPSLVPRAWIVAVPAGAGDPGPGDVRATRAGENGFATIRGLSHRVYDLAAFEDGSGVTPVRVTVTPSGVEATNVVVLARPEGRGLVLPVPTGKTLRVEVVDRSTGAPRPRCRADLALATEPGAAVSIPGPAPLASGRTGADGTVEFPGLDDREYEVTVVPEDHVASAHVSPPPFSVTARGKAGGDPVKVALDPRLVLDVALGGLGGPDPVGEAIVLATPVWEGYDRAGGFPSEVGSTWTRGDPSAERAVVRLEGLRPGRWVVRAWARGRRVAASAPTTLPAPSGRDVSLALERSEGVVVGRIVAAEDGRPLSGVAVEASEYVPWFSRDTATKGTTDGDGRFALRGVLDTGGDVRVAAAPPGRLRARSVARRVVGTVDVGDLVLVKSARLVVRLVDTKGAPVADARVELVVPGAVGGMKGDVWSESADAQGRAVFEGMRGGTYGLRFGRDGPVQAVPVAPGDDLERTLTVPAR